MQNRGLGAVELGSRGRGAVGQEAEVEPSVKRLPTERQSKGRLWGEMVQCYLDNSTISMRGECQIPMGSIGWSAHEDTCRWAHTGGWQLRPLKASKTRRDVTR